MRILGPYQASQAGDLAKGLETPRESDVEGQQNLITELSQSWGKQRLHSWRAQTKLWVHQDWPRKKSCDPTGDKLDVWVLEGLLWRRGLAVTCCGDNAPTAAVLGGVCWHKSPQRLPYLEPVGSRTELSQAKQLTEWEYSPTPQQITGLKIYWALSCPPKPDSVSS